MRKIFTIAILAFSINAFAQTPSYVPNSNLLGWYPFNGNANDESGNGNNGTLMNNPSLTSDRFGISNKAYIFDGVDDFIWLNFLSTLNGASQTTLSYWINSSLNFPNNTAGNYGTVFGHWKDNGQFNGPIGFQLAHNDFNTKDINLSFIGGQGTLTNSNLVDTSIWNNFTIVYDGTLASNQRVSVYKNGYFVQFVLVPSIPTTLGTEATRTYIGAACGPIGVQNAWSFFNGKIDDLGVWNRALTATEIANLYTGNICITNITVTDTLLINTTITGFNPVTYQNTIKVWPNPTNDHITIDNGNIANLTGYQIKITNSLSQQVFQSAITQQQFSVDLSTWTGNGIYFVHIIDGQGYTIDIKKIVLQ
jgi:hypothetical protein